MNYEKIILSDNKQIEILDGALEMKQRFHLYDMALHSYFKLGWGDSQIPERQPFDYHFYSLYNEEDNKKTGILDILKKTQFQNSLENLILKKCVINCSLPCSVFHSHIHFEKKVLLYYVNLEWKDGWHGETLFYSENLNKVEFCCPFTPGRLIVFDGSIPHTLRPQSIAAPNLRFTLTMFFD